MMRWWAGMVGLGGAMLAGCAAEQKPVIGADDAMALVRSGRPVLRCRDACLADWRRVQPQAQQLATAGRWQDLAVLVVQTGYQDDLSLYYLGRAAEGLRYQPAAASYYRQSLELSGTSISCANLSRQCGGVALPGEASLRLAALEHSPPRPRRVPAPPSAAPAPAGLPEPAGLPAPPPPPPPVDAAAPPPPAPAHAGAPADAADYIEPPPAQR